MFGKILCIVLAAVIIFLVARSLIPSDLNARFDQWGRPTGETSTLSTGWTAAAFTASALAVGTLLMEAFKSKGGPK